MQISVAEAKNIPKITQERGKTMIHLYLPIFNAISLSLLASSINKLKTLDTLI